MSETNNLLTKYLRKNKKNVNNEPASQLTLPTDEFNLYFGEINMNDPYFSMILIKIRN